MPDRTKAHMIYSKFTIKYFRSFQNIQTLKFAKPIADKIGSGITFIVGKNNTGKTTLVEGLFLRKGKRIKASEKQEGFDPGFVLYNENNEKTREVKLIRNTSSTLVEDPIDNVIFEMIPSRRHWQSTSAGSTTLKDFLAATGNEAPRSGRGGQTSQALKDIEADSEKYDKFISFVQQVIPSFSSFGIEYEDSEFVQYQTKKGAKHKSDFLGDGVISILRILSHLFLEEPRPLIIDEPELSLHPIAQKQLFKAIAKASQKRQIIISTHSPYFVSWEYIENGAILNKITKYQDEKSEIFTLNNYSTYKSLVKGANWQQPFLMDIVAKEIFFHDNLLFVEGQEDVGLLRQENDISEKANLFGYGVRGKDAFEFALQLAKDLGIKKAGVILDAGTNETSIKSNLKSKFPEYKIIQWNKEDIRDKKKYETKEKVGYFDKDGKKKASVHLGDYNEKIACINKYFEK
jgi:predicted ATP-dependent endonuclease of OLD family